MNNTFKFKKFLEEIVDRFPNLEYYQQYNTATLNETTNQLTYFQHYNSFIIPNRYIEDFFSIELFKGMVSDSEIERKDLLLFLKAYKVICHSNNQNAMIYVDNSSITFGCHKMTCKIIFSQKKLLKKTERSGHQSFGDAYAEELFPHLQDKVRVKLEKEIEHLDELSEDDLKLLSMIQY